MTEIIFLGTGGDSSVVGRQLRGTGGIVIQNNDLQLHIDPGPGALVRAKEFGVNVRATTLIICSNNHFFYRNDLTALVDAMTLGGLDKQGVLVTHSSVLPSLADTQKNFLEKVITLEASGRVAVEDVEILAVSPNERTMSFKIRFPGVVVGYTGDTAYTASLAKELQGSNVLIISMRYPRDMKQGKHLNRVDAINIIERVKPQLAVITGFGLELLKSDPLEESRAIQRATGTQTIAAHDGLRITPANYNAKNRQRRLGSFKESSGVE